MSICRKETAITIGLLLTASTFVFSIIFDQLHEINAQLDERAKILYIVPELKDDLKEIKVDIKDIKTEIRNIGRDD